MPTLAIRLDPGRLPNPDTDIRYVLPDLLIARSGGALSDEGYDYVGEEPYLILFLGVHDGAKGLAVVKEIIASEEVCGNKLSEAAVVALKEDVRYEVVYPVGFTGEFQTT